MLTEDIKKELNKSAAFNKEPIKSDAPPEPLALLNDYINEKNDQGRGCPKAGYLPQLRILDSQRVALPQETALSGAEPLYNNRTVKIYIKKQALENLGLFFTTISI